MSDLTLVYYTANRISDFFANNIRRRILEVSDGCPIISVSQKPIDFGKNICVGDIGVSTYNTYVQLLRGAKEVKTRYLACCEDDSVYTKDHLAYRPPPKTFGYNLNRWGVDKSGVFYHRQRRGLCMCIVETDTLVSCLESRFRKFPTPPQDAMARYLTEPGRFDHRLGLPREATQEFRSNTPTLTFNHWDSMSRRRSIRYGKDVVVKFLEPWGNADDVWRDIYGP